MAVMSGDRRKIMPFLTHKIMDKNGEWQTSSYLDTNDLPKAALVLSKAYDYLTSSGCGQREEEG